VFGLKPDFEKIRANGNPTVYIGEDGRVFEADLYDFMDALKGLIADLDGNEAQLRLSFGTKFTKHANHTGFRGVLQRWVFGNERHSGTKLFILGGWALNFIFVLLVLNYWFTKDYTASPIYKKRVQWDSETKVNDLLNNPGPYETATAKAMREDAIGELFKLGEIDEPTKDKLLELRKEDNVHYFDHTLNSINVILNHEYSIKVNSNNTFVLTERPAYPIPFRLADSMRDNIPLTKDVLDKLGKTGYDKIVYKMNEAMVKMLPMAFAKLDGLPVDLQNSIFTLIKKNMEVLAAIMVTEGFLIGFFFGGIGFWRYLFDPTDKLYKRLEMAQLGLDEKGKRMKPMHQTQLLHDLRAHFKQKIRTSITDQKIIKAELERVYQNSLRFGETEDWPEPESIASRRRTTSQIARSSASSGADKK